jgi:hypothetical protein
MKGGDGMDNLFDTKAQHCLDLLLIAARLEERNQKSKTAKRLRSQARAELKQLDRINEKK